MNKTTEELISEISNIVSTVANNEQRVFDAGVATGMQSEKDFIITGDAKITGDGDFEKVSINNLSSSFSTIYQTHMSGKRISVKLNVEITDSITAELVMPLITISESQGVIFAGTFSYPLDTIIQLFHVGWFSSDEVFLLRSKIATTRNLDNYATKNYVEENCPKKIDTINDTTSTDINIIELQSNSQLVYGEALSINVSFPENISLDYTASIIFTTPETIEYSNYSTFPDNVHFKGDECENGIFIPESFMRYTILFYFDGIKIIALVSGVSVND